MRTAPIAMAAALMAGLNGTCAATMSDAELERLITREIAPMVDEVGGAAIAVRMDGRTKFFNYGLAEAVVSAAGFAFTVLLNRCAPPSRLLEERHVHTLQIRASFLSYDEHEIILRSHHPEIYGRARKEKGVLSGKRVERCESGAPGEFADLENMTAEQFCIDDCATRTRRRRRAFRP
jgi:hypothetical protein